MPPEERARYLSLRGQMLYMQDWECICFIAIPMMQDLPQMLKTGVFINDLALHDSSRELLLAGTQQQAEIRLLLHQEATKAERLTESAQRLEMERQRTNNLLYQLLPAAVADKLRAGANPLETCQSFDCVTVSKRH